MPGLAPYAAVKHAVIGLTETLAAELAELTRVGASALCPGVVATDLARSSREAAPEDVGRAEPDAGAMPTTPRSGAILEPATVAEMVLAGIESGLVRIVAHRDSVRLVRRRLTSIEADLSVR